MYNSQNTVECLEHIKCTGCGACKNVCPVNAISMGEDSEFFIYPIIDRKTCINCGKCKRICPAIEPRYYNKGYETLIYAAKAPDDERQKSSSGGIFGVLASDFIKKGGLVCGVVFNDDFKAEHILSGNPADLERMRGSKYVQSDTNLIYRTIGSALKEGKKVLFTGCPCQVAGLNGYLEGKNASNLLTVDLLCHGVPSADSLKRYLAEISEGRKIKKVSFRDKRFGWRADKIRIGFEDGGAYESDSFRDPYLKGFLKNIMLRPSCADCPFCEYPRQGDITLGDFWGVSRLMPGAEDNKGVSIVMINNKTGEKAFNKIKDSLIYCVRYDGPKLQMPNRVKAVYPASPLRERFFDLIKKKDFIPAMEAAVQDRFDVGLVSNYLAENFGGALTQYALYRFLEDNGFSTLMIERPATAESQIRSHFKFFKERPYPAYSLAPQRKDKREMREFNDRCPAFVVGSDQLFQYELYRVLGKFTTLDWVSDSNKKIAYAASFGHGFVWGNKEEIARMGYFIRKFDAFSVRESDGQRIAREVFGRDAEWVLDPVFICGSKAFDTLIEKCGPRPLKNYVGGYILDPTEFKKKVILAAMEKLNLPCEIFSEFAYKEGYTAPLDGLNIVSLSMEERLASIRSCDFFVTDSFHGTCLAIIMRKPFVAILNKNRGASRFRSLLGHLVLSSRLIENNDLEEFDESLFSPIDYGRVYEILDKDIKRSSDWLLNALREQKFKGASDYDIFSEDLFALQDKLSALDKKLDLIIKKSGLSLAVTDDLHKYIDILASNKDKYIVFIAVKDTPGLALTPETAQKLLSLGINSNLHNRHWRSYAAIIDNGLPVYERLSPDERGIMYEGFVSGLRVKIESRSLKDGNLAKIIINGTDCSQNRRGLNFAVWDKTKNQIADSVCFDTHLPKYEAYRD